ncbi:hypothetical protein PHMEG_00011509 [Phytophthora megakarya]|uniref:Uncharacterized protein n=1 Tax=Phytophthora megakarya TaxID=4795 RepID=A0A225WC18_9STRA|nr:hypothetical protein PHMEG_00011509 [Phytophthora megakarya]
MNGGRYTMDADGDVEMSVPQPIYEVITAPRLTSWDPVALNVCITVKASLSAEMLESVATYVIGKSVSDVTDAVLTQLIRSRFAKVDDGYIPDLCPLFRETLSMNVKIDNAEARVLT